MTWRRTFLAATVLCAIASCLLVGAARAKPAACGGAPPAVIAHDLAAYLASPASYSLPTAIALDEAVSDVLRLTRQSGGATYNLYFGDQAGQPLYAVSIFPDLSRRVTGKDLGISILKEFIRAHTRLLFDPRCNVGTWYDAAHDETWLDISVTLRGRTQAVCLGRRYNQENVFDLRRMQEIATGGTGGAPLRLPPPERRLPRFGVPALGVADGG